LPKTNITAKSEEKTPKKKNTLLIIIMLVILAGSAVGAYSFINNQAAEGEVKKKVYSAEKEVLDMGDMVVNLNGSGGSRYLKVKVVLEYPKDKKLKEELTKKKHKVSDAIITVLRTKPFADVNAANSAQGLKDSIMEEINKDLVYGDITGLNFTDYLIQ
jgi:flagellar FliL protein